MGKGKDGCPKSDDETQNTRRDKLDVRDGWAKPRFEDEIPAWNDWMVVERNRDRGGLISRLATYGAVQGN